MMDSPELSMLSSLKDDSKSEDYIQPHYKESYRLAIDRLVSVGRENYLEFLKGERMGSFLSEDELLFITANVQQLPPQSHMEEISVPQENRSSSGTYWPMYTDTEAPDLDLGWPGIMQDTLQTNIDLLFHPPRENSPTIKEVVRKNIQEARQVICIVMDVFTDVDIFKEVVDASLRGVPVYILLDDFHLKSFLTMAENQDVKIQRLRNMRVRTVKGHNYLCRSGAKFHGAMQQRFLLVDCHTAIYGSYSFTWSSEKINLSMMQVITGHLVKSFDEEFRTLYARSSVPADLCPLESSFQQMLPKSHSICKIEKEDKMRHTLDSAYRKGYQRTGAMEDFGERIIEEEQNEVGPLIQNDIGVQNKMSAFLSAEAMNLKRHSYAGEREDGYWQEQNIWPKACNWNIPRESGNATNKYFMNNNLQVPHQNMLQASNTQQVRTMQQALPTMDNPSNSYMRTLRIESYLQNNDVPFGDSCDYLDQFDSLEKDSSFMQGRMRSSYRFGSNIREQVELNRHIHNSSSGLRSFAAPNAPLHYSSMQWNPTIAENRISDKEFMLKRQSLQIMDDNQNSTSYGPGRNIYQSAYATLGRAKGGHMFTNPDILTESWHKRHSMADPRSNTEYLHESPGPIYGHFSRMQINRLTTGINAQNGPYALHLNEDQRSSSHYDVKGITSTKNPNIPIWQEPPSRTVSAAALSVNNKDLTPKSNNMSSQDFLKKSSKKLKSLLNIPEKKYDSGMMETPSMKSTGSTAIMSREEEELSEGQRQIHRMLSRTGRSSLKERGKWLDGDNLKSKAQFRMEEHSRAAAQKNPSVLNKTTRTGLTTGYLSRDRGAENQFYSKWEPFSPTENKNFLRCDHSSQNNSAKREIDVEYSFTRSARNHHENKLEKFIQRMGNLIYKNK